MDSNRYLVMKRVVIAAALAAGVSGVASADDSSMGRIGGDSYAFFNNQPIDNSPSAWRQANPQGVPERVLQAESGNSSPVWSLDKPVFTNIAADASFKQEHPNGLTEHEFQALSSEGPFWHQNVPQATATASNGTTLADRVASFFGSRK